MPARRGTTSTRSRSPTDRVWPARCWSASTSPRRSPGSTTCRSSGSTTSRATSMPRGCAIPARRTEPDPVFPLVALVVSGGHTFLAEMRDHLTYRLLGTTLDDAAGEAFDKVGRLLGLGYPGGPAIGRAAEAATRHDRVFPRAWLGDSYDLSFSGLKTAARRIIEEARVGRRARPRRRTCRCPTTSSPSWRGASRTRSSTSSPRRRSGPPTSGRRVLDRGRRRRGGQRRAAGPAGRRGRGARAAAHRAAARRCAPTTGR